jgi:hypothetical protein
MAVVVVGVIPGGDQETYGKVSSKVMSSGQLPDGCQLHVAGPVDKGWRKGPAKPPISFHSTAKRGIGTAGPRLRPASVASNFHGPPPI